MEQIVLFILGASLVLAIAVDVLHTTIYVDGSGFITRRVSLLLWRLTRRTRAISAAGPIIVMGTVLVWFLLFWLGWCLIFLAGSESVVSDPDGAPGGVMAKIYFVGFSIITLGVGDYAPGSPLWQILTVLAAASGFFVVTLVITYLLPLISAVVEQRQLAAYVHSLGLSPQAMLKQGWNGSDYSQLSSHLTSLTPMLHRQTYLHLAYPILHYFRHDSRRGAIAPAVALLDDTLTVLERVVPTEQRLPRAVTRPARSAISELLVTLHNAYIRAAEQAPLLPDGDLPGKDGVETERLRDLQQDQQLRQRRCVLLGWLEDQGWQWHAPASGEGDRS